QRAGVEEKMILFVIDALSVVYAAEELGEARLTAACDHDTYVNRAPRECLHKSVIRVLFG
ncbi:MAG TPA: hypothetical protein VI386_19240, partial [Candidatus Sulfotelmatobacter sp.]